MYMFYLIFVNTIYNGVWKINIDNENKFDLDGQVGHNMNEDDMDTLSIFIQQNKDKIRNVSEKNVARNKEGVVVLPKNDEWDDFHKKVRNKK